MFTFILLAITIIFISYLIKNKVFFIPTFNKVIFSENKEGSFEKYISKKNFKYLIFLLIVLGILINYSIVSPKFIENYNYIPGISIFLGEIFYLVIIGIFFIKKENFNSRNIFIIFLLLILSFWFTIFTNQLFTYTFLIILIYFSFILPSSLLSKELKINKIFSFIFLDIFVNSVKNLLFSGKLIKKELILAFKLKKDKKNHLILSFLVLFLLLFLVIIPLLFSADKIFENIFNNYINFNFFIDFISKLSLSDIINILIIFIILLSFFITSANIEKLEFKEKIHIKIENIYSYVILTGINLVYLVFIIVQIKYILFGNLADFRSLQVPYYEYVHSGFYQLIAISIINYFIFIFLEKRNIVKNNILKTLFLILITFTIIISYSALKRIFLYIDAYSLTILRFFVVYIIFIIILFFLLSMMNLFRKDKIEHFYLYIFILFTYILIGYLNLDKFIANYNLKDGSKTDCFYIKNLSYDAYKEKLKCKSLTINIGENNKLDFNIKEDNPLSEIGFEKYFYYNYYYFTSSK